MGGVNLADARRVGLLGGTFDPPHVGHLWLAETARDQLELDAVLFLPVGRPPHKENAEITAVSHRLAMVTRAIGDNPRFALDTSDIERPPPHTTVTLIPYLRGRYPQAQFWLLLGGDSLRDLPTWHQPQRLIAQCRLAVLPRPGAKIAWPALETAVPGVRSAVDCLDGPTLPVSGTQLRGWAQQGHSIRHLTPTSVFTYLQQHKLY